MTFQTRNISALSNDEIVSAARTIVSKSNSLSAELIALLIEMDSRKLYLEQAHSSLFSWCVSELGASEDVVCNWTTVARLAAAYPVVLEYISGGKIHLTGLRMLAPHLNKENYESVLEESAGKSKREIEKIVARISPKPDVPSSIRKLPTPSTARCSREESESLFDLDVAGKPNGDVSLRNNSLLGSDSGPSKGTEKPIDMGIRKRNKVEPLSQERYKVVFTAKKELRLKIDEATALLRHKIPSGDIAEIIDVALDLLIEETKRKKFGALKPKKNKKKVAKSRGIAKTQNDRAVVEEENGGTRMKDEHNASEKKGENTGKTPGRSTRKSPEPKRNSRHIPAAIKRAVVERDGHRCTFVDEQGRRCNERGFLEFDHIEGFALNQEHSVEGIRLLCRFHNQHHADTLYGRNFMEAKRKQAPGSP